MMKDVEQEGQLAAMQVFDEVTMVDEVLRALRAAFRSLSQQSRASARDTGLTIPQVLCLRAAASLGPAESTVAAVAAEVNLSASTVSRILDRLERQGLAEKVRDDEDRRKVYVLLTEEGEERVDEIADTFGSHLRERISALSESSRQELLSSMELLVRLLSFDQEVGVRVSQPGSEVSMSGHVDATGALSF